MSKLKEKAAKVSNSRLFPQVTLINASEERGRKMDKEPRLLVWNFSPESKTKMDELLKNMGAPPAFTIEKNQGHLLVREILHTDKKSDREFEFDEPVVIFYNIPPAGIRFLMQVFRENNFPQPIYAVVTEHSINWPFSELIGHLVAERKEMMNRAKGVQTKNSGE